MLIASIILMTALVILVALAENTNIGKILTRKIIKVSNNLSDKFTNLVDSLF